MKSIIKHVYIVGGPVFTAVVLLLSVGLIGCDEIQDAKDNFDSQNTCEDYCAKKFDCEDHNPTSDESESCVNSCRNAIEDNCGNEYQAEANDKINECVDKGCTDFGSCMVFEAAPECFGFVSQ